MKTVLGERTKDKGNAETANILYICIFYSVMYVYANLL